MAPPDALSPAELAAITDPAALLDRAWALEPPLRLAERRETLARLEALVEAGAVPSAPADRAWHLELLAERAIDAAANVRLEEAAGLADRVLDAADPSHEIAIARALMARARVFAWTGTDSATRRADRMLVEVAERCRRLGRTEWWGFALFWRGNAVCYQNGELERAAELMRESLEALGPASPRRATVLDFYSDVLVALGEWDAAEAALSEAADLSARDEDEKSLAYVCWTRAHLASARGDGPGTLRFLREAERHTGDWWETHSGVTFLADAAEMLDRVGLERPARRYLSLAQQRGPNDEFVQQANATLLARSGDPIEALDALQHLARGEWLEKRLLWRHTLLTAWATFRAGRHGAGELAARALEQAHASGGLRVALAGEPELVRALAPLAERVGSSHGRELLLAGRPLLVRLLGAPEILSADGTRLELPTGGPGELVRMLAVYEHLPLGRVLGALFPGIEPPTARHRLRQFLARLRAACGEVVLRDGNGLRLVPAWVDLREYRSIAGRAGRARPPHAVRLAYAALALGSGPPLPTDRYASWAEAVCGEVESDQLALLDLIAADAAARGSHQEALTALDAARELDPFDPAREDLIARELLALGRHGTAEYFAARGDDK